MYHGGFDHHHGGFDHHNGRFHQGGFQHDNHHHAEFGVVPLPEVLPVTPGPPAIIPMLRGSIPEPVEQEQLIDCSMKCQDDVQCLEKCSAAWENLQKECVEVADIMACHQKCQDAVCHSSCPGPRDPWLKEKVDANMACHKECGDDGECHQHCTCPFKEIKEKCAELGPKPGSWKILNPTEVTV